MDGEAEPTMRLHLHVSHAVQGELFPSADAQPVTRGYRGTVAQKWRVSRTASLTIGRVNK